MRITKQEWKQIGGMRNPHCYRKESGGRWYYYCDPEFAYAWNG